MPFWQQKQPSLKWLYSVPDVAANDTLHSAQMVIIIIIIIILGL